MARQKEGPVSVYVYEVTDEQVQENSDQGEMTTGNHCAWCGDPPNEFGSHGICPFHAEQLIEQAAARRRKRGH